MTHRSAARVAGVLFIAATVPFSIAVVLLAPILDAPTISPRLPATTPESRPGPFWNS